MPEEPVNYETILRAVSAWTTSKRALAIAEALKRYFDSLRVHVTAFRASIVFPFPNDNRSWPVIEWKEGADKEFLAILHFDDKSNHPGECNWLVHYGAGSLSDQADEARWTETSISWGVTNMSHLKTLFGVAQHFLGILEWPPNVALKLYCDIEPLVCSQEEYAFQVCRVDLPEWHPMPLFCTHTFVK